MDNVNTGNIEMNINSAKVGSTSKMKEMEERKRPAKAMGGKRKAGVIVLIIGIFTLVAGAAFLLVSLLKAPVVRDADYLVEVGAWQMQNESSVVWNFKEIGKGSLTTNFHINDYDFIWAIDGDTLKVETEWLYTLNDNYTYKLDQNQKTLTLTSGENTYTFVPVAYDDEEATEK